MIRNIIGSKIKEARIKKGYSLRKLARETGIDVSYLSRIERGIYINPSQNIIDKLNKVLNVLIVNSRNELGMKIEKNGVGNKSAITQLVLVYRDDDLMLDFLKDTLDAFCKYIDIINQQENTVIIDKNRLSDEDLFERIKILDQHRRMVHNIIMTGIKRINILCRENNIETFYNGNEDDRVEIAEFAMKVIIKTFKNRKR